MARTSVARFATCATGRCSRAFALRMPGLAAVFLAAQLYRLWSCIRIRLETGDDFHRHFSFDEALDIAQEIALIYADQ